MPHGAEMCGSRRRPSEGRANGGHAGRKRALSQGHVCRERAISRSLVHCVHPQSRQPSVVTLAADRNSHGCGHALLILQPSTLPSAVVVHDESPIAGCRDRLTCDRTCHVRGFRGRGPGLYCMSQNSSQIFMRRNCVVFNFEIRCS